MNEEKIEELKNRIDLIVRKKDKPKLESDREELEKKIQEIGFWNDNESAQKIMKKLSDTKLELSELESLTASINDLTLLLF